jgi:hypothetical protein
MAKNLALAWTFMSPFFFMGLHMPHLSPFFSIHSSCLYWEKFEGDFIECGA